jgi:hypothetical protein
MKLAALAAFAMVCVRLELWRERGAVAPSWLAARESSPEPGERGGA